MCDKHKQRKRKDCPDCIAEIGVTIEDVVVNKVPCTLVTPTATVLKEVKEATVALAAKSVEKTHPDAKLDERKFIRVLIEAEVEKALAKIKHELSELKNIMWEHLDIPLSVFNMALMHKLGSEGWCYKDIYRGDIAKISGCTGDTVIMTRVKNSAFPPKPDFTKKSTIKKYSEEV